MIPIKTASKTQNIEIIESEIFFKKLQENGITKKDTIVENICLLLCIDKKYSNMLMMKKIKKVLSDFRPNKMRYFSQIGLNKRKLLLL